MKAFFEGVGATVCAIIISLFMMVFTTYCQESTAKPQPVLTSQEAKDLNIIKAKPEKHSLKLVKKK